MRKTMNPKTYQLLLIYGHPLTKSQFPKHLNIIPLSIKFHSKQPCLTFSVPGNFLTLIKLFKSTAL